MNEKYKPGVSEYGHPEFVARQTNSCILKLLLRQFLHRFENLNMLQSDKPFPNNHRRYSNHTFTSVDTSSSGSYKSLLNNL